MGVKNGASRIVALFARTRAEQRAALMPYLTLGYPTPKRSLELVQAVVAAGADALELGVPFSDPLADGPIIQQATQVALQQGLSVAGCLELVRMLRQSGVAVPFILMGYYNPILAYGETAFCQACRDVGVDGLIVPDLPPDEAESLELACRQQGLALIYLLTPTSPPERIRLIAERSQGYVYLVSVTGITGPREQLPPDLLPFVQRVRAETDKPLAVGFGISTPEQAAQVGAIADGVIVGSALVRLADESEAPEKATTFVAALGQAVLRNDPGSASVRRAAEPS